MTYNVLNVRKDSTMSFANVFDFNIHERNGFKRIPFFENDYAINRSGDVISIAGGRKIATASYRGYRYVSLWRNGSSVKIRLEKLFLIAYSWLDASFDDFQKRLDYVIADEAMDSLDIENIAWVIPHGGLYSVKYPDCKVIVGHPSVVLSSDQKVIDWKKGYEKSVRLEGGFIPYPTVFVRECTDKAQYPLGTTLVHRLVCLATYPLPKNKKDRYANHIDGNKNNYHPENLEWVNHYQNAIHACTSGLRPDCMKVHAVNFETGEKKIFYSLNECGRFLGEATESVRLACKYLNTTKCIKLRPWIVTDSGTWPDVEKCLREEVFPIHGRNLFFKIERDGVVEYVYGRNGMQEKHPDLFAGLPYPLRWDTFAVGGAKVSVLNDRQVPKEVLSLAPEQTYGNKPPLPISVVELSTGVKRAYASTEDFAQLVGARRKTIQRRMLYNNGIWNGYKIEYLPRQESPAVEMP